MCCFQFWFLLGGNIPLCSPRETVHYSPKREGTKFKHGRSEANQGSVLVIWIWTPGDLAQRQGHEETSSWCTFCFLALHTGPGTSISEAWFFPFYLPFCKLLPSPQIASLLKLASLDFCYPQPRNPLHHPGLPQRNVVLTEERDIVVACRAHTLSGVTSTPFAGSNCLTQGHKLGLSLVIRVI